MFANKPARQFVQLKARAPKAEAPPPGRPIAPADAQARRTAAELPLHLEGGTPERPRRVAVLVAHGMGQQLKFETLDLVVRAVQRGAPEAVRKAFAVEVELIRQGEKYVPRATTKLRDGNGEREVHFYEAWWAPLTEGQITTAETFWFLLKAGWDGASRAARRKFTRHMFGARQEFPLRLRTLLGFLACVGTIAGLGVMNAVVLAAAASRTISGLSSGWPSGALLLDLTTDFTWFVLVTVALFLVGVMLPRWLRRQVSPEKFRTPPAWLSHAGNWLMRGAALFTTYCGYRVAEHVLAHSFASREMPAHPQLLGLLPFAPDVDTWAWWLSSHSWYVLGIWGLIIVIGWRARFFVLQFVGDVAIYVSAHVVNRFYETRQKIQEAGAVIGRCVYGLRDRSGAPAYDRIIMVGHSLGSVIAYDLLNTMIREDADPDGPASAVRRTTAFITFGSPLDKTAFVFRAQGDEESQVREALAAGVQPLIADYHHRPRRWINLCTQLDWISGELNFYDRSKKDPAISKMSAEERQFEKDRQVDNRTDPCATTPLQAHTEYWDGPCLAKTLWEEIMRTDGQEVSA
jgi:hypothetical protein